MAYRIEAKSLNTKQNKKRDKKRGKKRNKQQQRRSAPTADKAHEDPLVLEFFLHRDLNSSIPGWSESHLEQETKSLAVLNEAFPNRVKAMRILVEALSKHMRNHMVTFTVLLLKAFETDPCLTTKLFLAWSIMYPCCLGTEMDRQYLLSVTELDDLYRFLPMTCGLEKEMTEVPRALRMAKSLMHDVQIICTSVLIYRQATKH